MPCWIAASNIRRGVRRRRGSAVSPEQHVCGRNAVPADDRPRVKQGECRPRLYVGDAVRRLGAKRRTGRPVRIHAGLREPRAEQRAKEDLRLSCDTGSHCDQISAQAGAVLREAVRRQQFGQAAYAVLFRQLLRPVLGPACWRHG